MGTNFYMQTRAENGRCRDVHLGKSSYGWTFSFHGYRDEYDGQKITNFFEWNKFIAEELDKGGIIFNEYDDIVDHIELIEQIEAKKDGRNHTDYVQDRSKPGYSHSHAQYCAKDSAGNSFSYCEFP